MSKTEVPKKCVVLSIVEKFLQTKSTKKQGSKTHAMASLKRIYRTTVKLNMIKMEQAKTLKRLLKQYLETYKLKPSVCKTSFAAMSVGMASFVSPCLP
jgi:hypothetical protein